MFLSNRKFSNRKIFKKKDGLNFRRRRRKIDFDKVRYILIFALELALVIALAYGVVISFGKQVECANASMEPTYQTSDILLVNTIAYKISKPQQSDVIAFKPKSNVNASYSVKRVIATPGDTIYINNGRIYINDELYKENLEVERIENPGIAATPITLMDDQYFVLGDNRNSSEDSRYESVGFVASADILGRVWMKYPF
ncbi:signal peptidase I [Pseudobutyrivibrio xylanivorans]|uniref:Signal peptidase I n=1 Tax=Pseudobutyrivibrio xylanivorans DSM 14809 TaxID=1123012 RepID=A0A1M6EC28_PSEXY|nr:signal peptidase I [Pseudobutyrivibrio xylanivorans]SHI83001.1 signal peptidase I [Pseudobutyrivibrio xylanivorans DSM 14809]